MAVQKQKQLYIASSPFSSQKAAFFQENLKNLLINNQRVAYSTGPPSKLNRPKSFGYARHGHMAKA
jgi:hypothetical protein